MTMAVITVSNPPTVRAPTGYAHGIVVEGAERRLIISGQVGLAVDGSVPTTGEGQIAQAFANLRAVLDANGMAIANVVKATTFLTDRALLSAFRAARGAVFGDHAPASTLVFVAGLADPRFMVEIEAEAVA
jgi:enamine deaminase RidA (YjgF/YER057c/UK114 family)